MTAAESASEAETFSTKQRLRLFQSMMNISGPALTGLVLMFLILLMLRSLGAQLFGVWVVTLSVVAWFAPIAHLRLSWTVTREIAAKATMAGLALALCSLLQLRPCILSLELVDAIVLAGQGVPLSRIFQVSR